MISINMSSRRRNIIRNIMRRSGGRGRVREGESKRQGKDLQKKWSQNKRATRPIWIRSIKGIPTRKYQCLVLCLKRNIPIIDPMLPPTMATENRVASGMRKAFFLALRLSIPIKANPRTFVITKYMIIRYKEFI